MNHYNVLLCYCSNVSLSTSKSCYCYFLAKDIFLLRCKILTNTAKWKIGTFSNNNERYFIIKIMLNGTIVFTTDYK